MRVVEVERVALGAVGQRGQQRARAPAPPDDRRLRVASGRAHHRIERGGERLGRAADGDADPVGEAEPAASVTAAGSDRSSSPSTNSTSASATGVPSSIAHERITCSVVMMIGASPGAMNFGSSP